VVVSDHCWLVAEALQFSCVTVLAFSCTHRELFLTISW
jgi:hypothetical protein